MKKIDYVMLGMLLCFVVAASGCVNPWSGSGNQTGNETTNQTDVQGVSNVVLNGPGALIIQQGNQDSFTVEADNSTLSKISTQVSGSSLVIKNLNSVSNGAVKYHLTLKNLDTITLHGNGEANVTKLNTSTLTTTVDAGKITLAGTTTDHIATVNGGGEINARDLQSQTATVTINRGGSAIVDVVKTLKAIVNGGGSISYLGNPQVTPQINGMGTVTKTS
jgi:hypothetical protein